MNSTCFEIGNCTCDCMVSLGASDIVRAAYSLKVLCTTIRGEWILKKDGTY